MAHKDMDFGTNYIFEEVLRAVFQIHSGYHARCFAVISSFNIYENYEKMC